MFSFFGYGENVNHIFVNVHLRTCIFGKYKVNHIVVGLQNILLCMQMNFHICAHMQGDVFGENLCEY